MDLFSSFSKVFTPKDVKKKPKGFPKAIKKAKPIVTPKRDLAEASAKRSDLYKMHTYRDAMRLRSAVIVYPGDKSIFYDQSQGRIENPNLRDILLGDLNGIGAMRLSPVTSSQEFIV